MSIRYKILLPLLAITLVAVIATLATSVVVFTDYIDDSDYAATQSNQRVIQANIDDLMNQAAVASGMISDDRQLIKAIEQGDRNAIIARAQALQAQTGVEFTTLVDMNGDVVARSHEPEKFGDSLKSQLNISNALTGKQFTGIEKGTAVRLSIRSGAPIYADDGRQIGVVSSGFRLDQNTFVDRMKNLVQAEVSVYLDKEAISTTLTDEKGERAVGTEADAKITETVIGGQNQIGKEKIYGRGTVACYWPVESADGNIIGMIFVGKYTEASSRAITRFVIIGVIIALIVLGIAFLVVTVLTRKIMDPIKKMLSAAESIAQGNPDVSIDVTSKDEMQDLALSFNKMIDETKKQAVIIEQISTGDLSGDITIRSDKDIVGIALKNMLDMNNNVFTQIVRASNQVNDASSQMAQGALNLAQGATEQAGSIENLSEIISKTHIKTKTNSSDADEAHVAITRVGSLMEDSTQYMSQMLESMRGISEASDNISKIIKTIDEIAFQTNILALNAAVEAAHAGQHGKGFAVVAEEVRNLAAKSTAAANETSELIAGSASRVQEGNQIVKKTNESLNAVARSAAQSAEIISKISGANREQETELEQISYGISQIASVVSTNSATSEELAASSEELAAQAKLLLDLVERFKLIDTPSLMHDNRY